MAWDDDIDVMVDHTKKAAILQEIKNFRIDGINGGEPFLDVVKANCHKMVPKVESFGNKTSMGWRWPFLDVFFYEIEESMLREIGRDGKPKKTLRTKKEGSASWDVGSVFPLRIYYLSGAIVPGPKVAVARNRYSMSKCKGPFWNHRRETYAVNGHDMPPLDCCLLAEFFPFVHRWKAVDSEWELVMVGSRLVHATQLSLQKGQMEAGGRVLRRYQYNDGSSSMLSPPDLVEVRTYTDAVSKFSFGMPARAFDLSFARNTWLLDQKLRVQLRAQEPQRNSGEKLTKLHARNLDVVEIDNSIADTHISCRLHGQRVQVLAINAQQGTHWPFLAQYIRSLRSKLEPTVELIVLLNEMDVGMARSGNMHTARMLAYTLRMNYAWGVEFIELTNGSWENQRATKGQVNDVGLTGNAVLSTCVLRDFAVIRDKLGDAYFSNTATFVNGNGAEKRLGGRMILLGNIISSADNKPTTTVRVGSIHKLGEFNQKDGLKEVENKLRSSAKRVSEGTMVLRSVLVPVIIGGDQSWGFCETVGLRHVDDKTHHTWKASCNSNAPQSYGGHRGDILCSNLGIFLMIREKLKKCYKKVEKSGGKVRRCLKKSGSEKVNQKKFRKSERKVT